MAKFIKVGCWNVCLTDSKTLIFLWDFNVCVREFRTSSFSSPPFEKLLDNWYYNSRVSIWKSWFCVKWTLLTICRNLELASTEELLLWKYESKFPNSKSLLKIQMMTKVLLLWLDTGFLKKSDSLFTYQISFIAEHKALQFFALLPPQRRVSQ